MLLETKNHFHVADYVVLIMLLLISMGIGVFFAVKARISGNVSRADYLMGNRELSLIPVTLSLAVSMISGNTLLGSPAEVYIFGGQFVFIVFGAILAAIITAIFFIPVIYPLRITSANEYLYRRFKSKSVQCMASAILIINQILYIGCVIFGPAIAMETGTGIPAWFSIIVVSFIGTAYTALGGMKAVVWADAFQSVIMLGGMICIIILGTQRVGGWDEMWSINDEWGRIFIDYNPDPTARMTLWTCVLGYNFFWLGAYAVNQPCVQRYNAMPTMTKSVITMLLNAPVYVVLHSVSCLAGMVVFAFYAKKGCDPLTSNRIHNSNQIVPYFVMDILNYPCLPGIFISSIFSAALSTLSSSINSMAAVVWQDFLEDRFPDFQESRKTHVTKFFVVFFGLLCSGVSFIVLFVGGNLMQIATSFFGCTIGPLLGVFTLGAAFPFANYKGALSGGIVSIATLLWIMFGQIFNKTQRSGLPMATTECDTPEMLNQTSLNSINLVKRVYFTGYSTTETYYDELVTGFDDSLARDEPMYLYRIAFSWYSLIGFVLVLIIGVIVSLLTGGFDRKDLKKRLLFPIVRPCVGEDVEDYIDSRELEALKKKSDEHEGHSVLYDKCYHQK